MKIRIEKLELTNFKCFRSQAFKFNQDIVTIQGRNGVGKTTIFDAILFCLFGKNSQDQTKFDIKTHDSEGNVIPHLDHAVELELRISDGPTFEGAGSESLIIKYVTLRHSVKEKWNKKRGATEEVFAGDTHEYFVNGELYTAADYKKYIASLIDEQTFRILTNPQYFTSLKWQDQRTILTKMVGEIEPEVIANTDELAALMRQLQAEDEDIIAYKKHLGYQIKKIKEQLEKIPVRLEEQNKALPELLDWEMIDGELKSKKKTIEDIDKQILSIRQGNGADVTRTELRNQISATTMAIDKKVNEARAEEQKLKAEQRTKISEAALKFNAALNNQKLMEQTIEADNRLIRRCHEIDFESELQKLRDQWPSSKFVVDPNAAYCPTCGQPIPEDQYKEKVEEMRRNFNLAREKKVKDLNERAAIIKKDKADTEEELIKLEAKLAEDLASLEHIKEDINQIFSDKAKMEKEHVKTAEEILSEDEQYTTLLSQLSQLKDALEKVADSDDDRERLTELESKRSLLLAETENLQTQLASKSQYDKVIRLIDDINDEQKDLVQQLSDLERKEDIARQYEDRQNEILESRVNEHFSITRWKMFRTVVNNGDPYNEPFCECYDLNGTAYHDGLNQAARLNIGLDIINAMSRVYNTSAPVVIDQSESTLNILPTTGQQLRLCVKDTDLQVV